MRRAFRRTVGAGGIAARGTKSDCDGGKITGLAGVIEAPCVGGTHCCFGLHLYSDLHRRDVLRIEYRYS